MYPWDQRMAKVAQVVHRHAAHIHAHMAGFERDKFLQVTRQRVVDTERHGRVGKPGAGRKGQAPRLKKPDRQLSG